MAFLTSACPDICKGIAGTNTPFSVVRCTSKVIVTKLGCAAFPVNVKPFAPLARSMVMSLAMTVVSPLFRDGDSPRVATIAVFDPALFEQGRQSGRIRLEVANFVLIFIEGTVGRTVIGRIVLLPGGDPRND